MKVFGCKQRAGCTEAQLYRSQSASSKAKVQAFRGNAALPSYQLRVYKQNGGSLNRGSCSAASSTTQPSTASESLATYQVVVTREAGKNGKLKKALEAKGVYVLEMPLIETAAGPQRDQLPAALSSEPWDWVCITSPEAASVFMEGWKQAGRPAVRVAVVGEGTGKVLASANEETLVPQFTPTVANAEHFGPELPFLPEGTKRILYPASNKASSILQEGLLARGFEVIRLNTYDTLPVKTLDPNALEQAKKAAVVAVASPSAVKAWVGFVGDAANDIAVACIGSTSARAAEKLGLQRIYYPEEPSIENFVKSILEALEG